MYFDAKHIQVVPEVNVKPKQDNRIDCNHHEQNQKKIDPTQFGNNGHLRKTWKFGPTVTISRLLWLIFHIFVQSNFETVTLNNIFRITVKNNDTTEFVRRTKKLIG